MTTTETTTIQSAIAFAIESGDFAKIGGSAWAVYVFISTNLHLATNSQGMKIEDISLGTGLGERQVMRAIAELKKFSYIAYSKDGKANAYSIIPKPTTAIDLSKMPLARISPQRNFNRFRYIKLRESGGKCCLCGRSAKDGAILSVDHIKCVAHYPELADDPDNFQVLCLDCNMGKSDIDDTDWRWDEDSCQEMMNA